MTRTVLRRTSLPLVAIVAALVLLGSAPVTAAPAPLTGSGTGSIIAEAATSPIAVAATGRPSDAVFSLDGSTAYVAIGVVNAISIIDVATNTETGTIPLPAEPNALVLSPDGLWLYASDFAVGLQKISTATQAVTSWAAPGLLVDLALNLDGSRLYGVDGTSVQVVDTTTGANIASIPAGFTGGASIAMSPDGARLYAGSIGDNKIVVLDPATNSVVNTITGAGAYPTGLAFSADGSKLYATAQLDDSISIIDTATDAVLTTGIPAGVTPTRITVSPNGLYGYVSASSSNKLFVLDLSNNATIASPPIGAGSNAVAVSPDGTRIFVANYSSNDVTAFDVAQLAFSGQAEVTPGSDATFALSLTNGNSPIANYTGGTAVIELLDSSSAVVSTGAGVSPAVDGTAALVIPTAGLPLGSYTVRITFTDPAGVIVARAAGFSIAALLAATGSDSGPLLAVALVLVVLGVAMAMTRVRASGRRTSRSNRRG
jgi:YVTN family beta-propeller protein